MVSSGTKTGTAERHRRPAMQPAVERSRRPPVALLVAAAAGSLMLRRRGPATGQGPG
jgi:hypothetical protein